MALANNWLRNGHMNTSRPMISEGNLLRTSEDGFLVFKTKGQKGMVFSSGIVVCSVEAKNCVRLKMKPRAEPRELQGSTVSAARLCQV